MMNAIELRGVSKRWGTKTVLDQVDLDIPKGSIFALLGDNGVGKTTLLKLILGLEDVSSGSVRLLDQLNERYCDSRLRMRIGYVPERPEFPGNLSAWQLAKLDEPFLAGGFAESLASVLEKMRVDAHDKIANYSKGNRTKLALAYALAKNPELLILDEPTSGLDVAVRQEVLDHLIDLAVEGRTVLLTSHMIHEVERVADTVAILKGSKLIRVARVDDLKRVFHVVNVHCHSPLNERPTFDAIVHHVQQRGRDWEFMVETEGDLRLQCQQWVERGVVAEYEVRTASLEAIYLALTRVSAPQELDSFSARVVS